MTAERLGSLSRSDRIEIDAFLLQFLQLAGMLQDKLTRLLLVALEQDLSRSSRRDMRDMLEKVHALEPERDFGSICDVRNRLAHGYPLKRERAAAINEAFRRSADPAGGFADMTTFSNDKFFKK